MTSEPQILQFDISDKNALLAFLKEAYAEDLRKSDPAFWEWHFLANPFVDLSDIPLWVVKSDGRITGQLAAMPIELKIGDHRPKAIWILDFVILPELRGKGLGKRLMLTVKDSIPVVLALGMNERSEPILVRSGWQPLGHANRYHRLLFPGYAVPEIAKIAPVRKLVNLIYAPFRPRLSGGGGGSSNVRPIENFGAEFDELWDRAQVGRNCAVVRSSKFLEWQFKLQPGKKFDVIGCFDGERLVGYVVLFFRKSDYDDAPPKAAISDIFYDVAAAPLVVRDLLHASIDLAVKRRAGSLVTDVLDERVESELLRLGFWRVKSSPKFMAVTAEHEELIYDKNNWFVTRGDCDVSIFEHPNL